MAVSATYRFDITVQETLATSVPDVADPILTHNQFNSNATLNATSTPPATKSVSLTPTLSGGTLVLDLTNLTGTNGATVDATTLKLQLLLFNNPTGNSSVVISDGASNAYLIFGHAAGEVTIFAGDNQQNKWTDTLADVSATVKNVLLTGTGTDAFEMVMVFG